MTGQAIRTVYTSFKAGSSSFPTQYGYDALGRLTQITFPPQHAGESHPIRTMEYLDSDRQIRIVDRLGSDTLSESLETYDGLGRFTLAEWKDETGARRLAGHMKYDPWGRVKETADGSLNYTQYGYRRSRSNQVG